MESRQKRLVAAVRHLRKKRAEARKAAFLESVAKPVDGIGTQTGAAETPTSPAVGDL